jgi:hypothetical protein
MQFRQWCLSAWPREAVSRGSGRIDILRLEAWSIIKWRTESDRCERGPQLHNPQCASLGSSLRVTSKLRATPHLIDRCGCHANQAKPPRPRCLPSTYLSRLTFTVILKMSRLHADADWTKQCLCGRAIALHHMKQSTESFFLSFWPLVFLALFSTTYTIQ